MAAAVDQLRSRYARSASTTSAYSASAARAIAARARSRISCCGREWRPGHRQIEVPTSARVRALTFPSGNQFLLDRGARGEKQAVPGDPDVGERHQDAVVLEISNPGAQRGDHYRGAQRCRARILVEPGPAGPGEVIGRPGSSRIASTAARPSASR